MKKFQSMDDSPWKRSFALAIAAPIYKLKPDSTSVFYSLDHFSLVIKAIEFCLEGLDLGSLHGRIEREDLRDYLVGLIEIQFEVLQGGSGQPDTEEVANYATNLIKKLLNIQEGREFSEQIFSYETREFKRIGFHLLEEIDGHDNNFYIQASVECINLYLNALSQELVDRQIACQAILEHQIKTGKLNAAARTVEDHYTVTIQQKKLLLKLKSDLQHNIKNVHWVKDIAPQLRETEFNLDTFRNQDSRILRHIDNDPNFQDKNTQLLLDIKDKIWECIRIYNELHILASGMGKSLRDAQDNQIFVNELRYQHLPEPTKDIICPMMELEENKIEDLMDELSPLVTTSAAPFVDDLRYIIQMALVERDQSEDSLPHQEDTFDKITSTNKVNIKPEEIEQATDLINFHVTSEGIKLKELIEEAKAENYSEGVIRALVIRAHNIFIQSEDFSSLQVQSTGEKIKTDNFEGDNLFLVLKSD